jgi:hypothetical protein
VIQSINPDLVLSNGQGVTFDLGRITVREYRSLADPEQRKDQEDEVLAKAIGWTVEQVLDMPVLDYKRVWVAFFQAFSRPVRDDGANPLA